MKAAILHLSDTHLKEKNNPIVGRIDKMAAALRSLEHLEHIYVVLSGDLANSGKTKEYEIALEFLTKLGDRIKNGYGIGQIEYVIVPGNHDCNFDYDSQNRILTIESLRRNSDLELSDDSIINTLTTIQNDFFSFLEALMNRKYEGSERLSYEYRFSLDKVNIVFTCYNSAWMNEKENRKGTVMFPLKRLRERPDGTDIVCSVFHHPYSWFDVENSRRFRRFIEANSDIILTGHEHELDQTSQKHISGTQNEFLNGGRLQCDDDYGESKFQVQLIDTSNNSTQCIQFSWTGGNYTKINESEQRVLTRQHADAFLNNPEFTEYLNDADIMFIRPERSNLRLDDIFVYPNVRLLDAAAIASDVNYTIIRGERLLAYLIAEQRIAIFGSDRSGKTGLLKSLYKDLQNRGLVPILIQSDRIISEHYSLAKIIDGSFGDQYYKNRLENYRQLDKLKRVVLVDNVHRLVESRLKNKLISELTEFASTVVITSDDYMSINDLVGAPGSSALVQFKHLFLSDFSYETTGHLIEKWVSSRRQPEDDEATLAYRIKTLEHSVNNFVRNRVFPPNPFVILSLLQILEADVPSKVISGSYGYLYEFLITGAFSSASREAEDLDIKYNFLAYLANFMFERHISEVTDENLSQIAYDFSKYATVTIMQENLKQELIASRVMKSKDGAYRFAYSYVYHYFMARYLSTIIRDPAAEQEFKAKIALVIENLQLDESANILVFLCYLAPGDASLIDKIIEKGRELFSSQKQFSFPSDSAFFDQFVYKEPVITVADIDPETAREISRQFQDAQTHETSRTKKAPLMEVPEGIGEVAKEVRLAYRVMYVLGQILRSFPGSRGYRKRPLADECCNLGMRLLSAAMKDLEKRSPAFKQEFADYFRREVPKSSEEFAMAHANSFLFLLALLSSQGMINAIALSIGSARLAPLYEEILSEDHSVTFQLVNICIRLNHFKAVPEREIIETYHAVKNKHFTSTLLKMIAIDSLLKNPPSRSKQQSVFDQLGIILRKNPLLIQDLTKARLLGQGK